MFSSASEHKCCFYNDTPDLDALITVTSTTRSDHAAGGFNTPYEVYNSANGRVDANQSNRTFRRNWCYPGGVFNYSVIIYIKGRLHDEDWCCGTVEQNHVMGNHDSHYYNLSAVIQKNDIIRKKVAQLKSAAIQRGII